MSIGLLELLLQAAVFAVVSFLAYVVFSEYSDKTSELKQQSVRSGDSMLAELYIGMSPEAFFFLRLVAALVCLAFGILLLNFTIGLFLAAGGFVVPYFILKSQKEKRVRRVEAQLVDGLELLGNSLRSGLTLQQAVELLVREFPPPLSQEFSLVLAETRVGVEFAEALERMARRLDSNVVFILSTGIAIVKQCGGDMTQIFANIANTIREQATIEGKMHAVTAQGRFQGLILGLMPFALMFVLYLIDPTHIETLFRYQIGIWAFAAMVVMIILAQVWIRKLLELDV